MFGIDRCCGRVWLGRSLGCPGRGKPHPYGPLRQAKVQDLGHTMFGDEDVRGLDVAMYDPFPVRGLECPGGLDGEIEQFIDR